MTTIEGMSREELKAMIEETVDQRLEALGMQNIFADDKDVPWSWDQTRAYFEQHRWTPPPGTPSAVELVREERRR